MNQTSLKTLIRNRCGIDLGPSSDKVLAEALAKRSRATGISGESDYYLRVHGDQQEFLALVGELTVNETYFYREPEQIRFFIDRLVPRVVEKTKDPIRILSAGCSTGEEVYTLAIALAERFPGQAPGRFSILGFDIDREALEKARVGTYRDFSFRTLDPGVKRRYFEPSRSGFWDVCSRIRPMVRFEHYNLLSPEGIPDIGTFDAVFFRNVSIYFDEENRRKAFARLKELLKDGGYLLTGVSETLSNDFGMLPLVEENGIFYFSSRKPPAVQRVPAPKAAPGPFAVPAPPPRPAAPPVPGPAAPPGPLPVNLAEVVDMVRDKKYDAALDLISGITPQPGTQTGVETVLVKGYIALVRKDYTSAEALARTALETDPWSTDAAVVLGLAAKWQDRPDQAVAWFKQAVYACQSCWPAQYYLAELYRSADEPDKATRAYRTVLQALEGSENPATGLKVIPLDLPVGDLRFLCGHRLGKTG